MPQKRIELDVLALRRAYLEDGLTTAEIGEIYHVSYRTVRDRLKESGVDLRSPGRRACGICPTCHQTMPMRLAARTRVHNYKRKKATQIDPQLLELRKAGLA